jgi:hypothetical protein
VRVDVRKATALLQAIAAVDESSSLTEVKAAVRDRGRLVAMLDSEGVRLARLLAALTGCPDKAFGDAARSSQREGRRMRRRGDTAAEVPAFGDALANGDVSGEHLDLMGSALRDAEGDKRKKLVAKADELLAVAKTATPDEFARRLRDELRRLDGDDGSDKLKRQKSGSRLWHKSDSVTGMGKIWMQIDPLNYAKFVARNDATVSALFAEKVPEGCPTDPTQKQAFLRAMAFIADLNGEGPTMGRPEVIVVLDGSVLDDDGEAVADWGLPVELPRSVLEDLLPEAVVTPVVVKGGFVVHAPGRLDLGRSTRLANAAQRRVLRALYPRCAVPDCDMSFRYCKIHHVVWWRHGGRTDLDNLLPVCVAHHTELHRDEWDAKLQPDRTLTITMPNGDVMTCGPPKRAP